ncbi:MAG TPA: YhjD/YihY/BrkB family envelope integrity protein [Solirubrobacteraceae bacterium]|jgi:membrane protein
MLLAPAGPVGTWLQRLVAVQAADRAVAIGAQAFGALIPLLIVYSSVVPVVDSRDFATSFIERMGLKGSAAETMREVLIPPTGVAGGVTAISFVLVVVSALALARALQRLYEVSYELPASGFRGTPWHLLWIAMIPVYLTLRPLLADLAGGWWHIAGSLLLGAGAWLATPYILLGRRLNWLQLIPGAVFTSLGMTALGGASLIYLPHSVSSSARHYGAIGVAFSLLSWLVLAGFVLVGTATAGAVTLKQVEAYRLRRGR